MDYDFLVKYIILIVIIYALLMILLPVFVYAISARAKSIDKKLDKIIELLRVQPVEVAENSIEDIDKDLKVCSHCGSKNFTEDSICRICSKPIQQG